MSTTKSADGTRIAFDQVGQGPAVILVAGTIGHRAMSSILAQLASLLAPHFTVIDYDRRGRGESGNTLPYAVEREVEDIEALIDQVGGTAYLCGHSSGAALALEAALQLGDKVGKLVMYEAPYNDDEKAKQIWREYIRQLTEALAANRSGDAVALFMRLRGATDDQIQGVRQAPIWQVFEAVAPTLAYDHSAILGQDAAVPTARAAGLRIPALILNGGASDLFMRETALALANAIPGAQHRTLEGQTHDIDPEALAPVLIEFLRS